MARLHRFGGNQGKGRNRRAILNSSLDMGKRLGVSTVAEGVETAAQSEFLRAAGCDVLQGYLICRPCEPGAFEAWAQTPLEERIAVCQRFRDLLKEHAEELALLERLATIADAHPEKSLAAWRQRLRAWERSHRPSR